MNFISQQYNLNDTGMYNRGFFRAEPAFARTISWILMASVSYAVADSKTLIPAVPDAVSGRVWDGN